jgi:uncharacterized protein with GYD domain
MLLIHELPRRGLLGNRGRICPYGHELLVPEVQVATFGGIMITVGRVSPPGKREKGGKAGMPTYVTLMNWTDQGIRNVKDAVQRYDRSTDLANKHGVSYEQVYWTVGPHDLVVITEAPDVESVSAFLLELSSEGNLKTTTLPAFNRDGMSSLLERLD